MKPGKMGQRPITLVTFRSMKFWEGGTEGRREGGDCGVGEKGRRGEGE